MDKILKKNGSNRKVVESSLFTQSNRMSPTSNRVTVSSSLALCQCSLCGLLYKRRLKWVTLLLCTALFCFYIYSIYTHSIDIPVSVSPCEQSGYLLSLSTLEVTQALLSLDWQGDKLRACNEG